MSFLGRLRDLLDVRDERPPEPPPALEVAVRGFDEEPFVLSFGKHRSTSLQRLAAGTSTNAAGEAFLLVLSGRLGDAGPADVRTLAAGDRAEADEETLVLLETSGARGHPAHLVRAEGAHGSPFPGLTGLRCLHRGETLAVLRLGPPPGARWVVTGLHALAVFTGAMEVLEEHEVRVARAGQLLVVSDPRAAVRLQSGRDSARAVAIASTSVTARLG